MRKYARLGHSEVRTYSHEEAAEPRRPPIIIATEIIIITYKFRGLLQLEKEQSKEILTRKTGTSTGNPCLRI